MKGDITHKAIRVFKKKEKLDRTLHMHVETDQTISKLRSLAKNPNSRLWIHQRPLIFFVKSNTQFNDILFIVIPKGGECLVPSLDFP